MVEKVEKADWEAARMRGKSGGETPVRVRTGLLVMGEMVVMVSAMIAAVMGVGWMVER